jgi:hypothetical protein
MKDDNDLLLDGALAGGPFAGTVRLDHVAGAEGGERLLPEGNEDRKSVV